MDRIAPVALHLALAVDRLADDVEQAAERRFTDGHGDRPAGRDRFHPAAETVGRRHGDGTHPVVAEMLLDFGDHLGAVLARDSERVVDLGQVTFLELNIQDRADDLHDPARVLPGFLPCGTTHR